MAAGVRAHSILPWSILAIGSAIIGVVVAESISQSVPEGVMFASAFAANVVLVIRLVAEPAHQTEAV